MSRQILRRQFLICNYGIESTLTSIIQRGNFLSRRVATGEVVCVGTCPTIEIVGLGLKRCVATVEVFFVGKEGWD